MPRAHGKDITEIFGHVPDDLTPTARSYWAKNQCPFSGQTCIKWNHDNSICYGVCSVTGPGQGRPGREHVIICPRRLYADNHEVIRQAAMDAFPGVPFLLHQELQARRLKRIVPAEFAVAVGHGSGKEIQVGGGDKLSMDWVIAHFRRGQLSGFIGLEVQSIDTTGSYLETWTAYKTLPRNPNATIPMASNGLNWANVHKRLIPQIIRKGEALHASPRCQGLYFVVPDEVYKRFEGIIGTIDDAEAPGPGVLTVMTYGLGPEVPPGQIRALVPIRTVRVKLAEFAAAFIAGGKLLDAEELERRIVQAV